MKLSEAIELGDTLRTRDASLYLEGDCGCAWGGVILALGIPVTDNLAWFPVYQPALMNYYPWLTESHIDAISVRFDRTTRGEMSWDSFMDYVRSIEPVTTAVAEMEYAL